MKSYSLRLDENESTVGVVVGTSERPPTGTFRLSLLVLPFVQSHRYSNATHSCENSSFHLIRQSMYSDSPQFHLTSYSSYDPIIEIEKIGFDDDDSKATAPPKDIKRYQNAV
jgi:hypothetical protein